MPEELVEIKKIDMVGWSEESRNYLAHTYAQGNPNSKTSMHPIASVMQMLFRIA